MYRFTFLFILSLFSSTFLLGQDRVTEPAEEDSFNYNKVMIIPYNNKMYFADEERKLAEENDIDLEELRWRFRYGLGHDVSVRVMSRYDTKRLLTDTSKDVQEDLQAIYKNIGYSYSEKDESEYLQDGQLASASDARNRENDSIKTRSAHKLHAKRGHVRPTEEDKYMDVTVHNKDMLKYLAEKYNTDLFLFVNQFELKTEYKHCLDRTVDNFQRQVIVHYTIMNANGTKIHGNAVRVYFNRRTNDLDAIIQHNFPVIAKHIMKKMPKKKKIKDVPEPEEVVKQMQLEEEQENGENNGNNDWMIHEY